MISHKHVFSIKDACMFVANYISLWHSIYAFQLCTCVARNDNIPVLQYFSVFYGIGMALATKCV